MGKWVLAGGGTGGHVYPALAIGDALRAAGHDVLYYGDADRLEGRAAPARGYAFRPVKAPQFPRAGVVGKWRFALSLFRATLAVRRQLKADGVDRVLGVGGYIAAPTVLAAWSLGLRTALHEANVVPGLANKLCARVVDLVLLTFEATASKLPGTAPKRVVGVPVSARMVAGPRSDAAARYGLDPARPVAVFVGGSLGAARINELALAVARLPERDFQVVHMCGPKYEAAIRADLAGASLPGYTLVGYEDRMEVAYAVADLVVCRSGSATLAELAAVGRGSLLIPSPNVTENHQEGNARGFEAAGAAEVLVEAGWDLDVAVARVVARMKDADGRRAMHAAASTLARPAAAAEATALLLAL
jgi:UDP-N-acetylglucosamine--N-acetylmuramyl-(pentapeptide) pyrophosphoryl-undecaprenol N-acetylglucosamine transferase